MTIEEITANLAQINPLLANAIQQSPWLLPLIIIEAIMKVVFYPIAMYASAKKQKKAWFIILVICFLFLNDYALLPILYLVFNRKKTVGKIVAVQKKKKGKK